MIWIVLLAYLASWGGFMLAGRHYVRAKDYSTAALCYAAAFGAGYGYLLGLIAGKLA